MLHAAFWRHGASDLDLPTWCWSTMRTLFEPDFITGRDDTTSQADALPSPSPPFLLDFLYSKRTRAYLRRLSAACHSRLRSPRNITLDTPSTLRDFTSTTLPQKAARRGKGVLHKLKSNSQLSPDSSADVKELTRYLVSHKQGEYQDVWTRSWNLYCNLRPKERSPDIIAAMMDFMAASPRESDYHKTTRLLDDLPSETRTPKYYLIAIRAYMKRKDDGNAFFLVEEALKRWPDEHSSKLFNVFFSNCVERKLWQMAFQIYQVFSRFCCESLVEHGGSPFDRIDLRSVRNISPKVKELLSAVQDFPALFSTDAGRKLVALLIFRVLEVGSSFGSRQTRRALEWLYSCGFLTPEITETAILTMLGHKNPSPVRVHHAFGAYETLLVEKLASARPSIKLLRTLLRHGAEVNDRKVVQTLFNDWHRYRGVPLIGDTSIFMKFFANHGDVEQVNKAFDHYMSYERRYSRSPVVLESIRSSRETAEESMSIPENAMKLFNPLLHVHAMRGDPPAVEQQLLNLEADFAEEGFRRNTVCYNVLMHAYARIDDLDGASSCMATMIDEGLLPDDYSYGTLMSVAADRGDHDLIDELEAAANDAGVKSSQVMRDSHVLSLLNNGMPGHALTYARETTTEYGHTTATRMWNQVLAFNALNYRDAKSVQKTVRYARLMGQYGVPFDAMTFAAILRSFVVRRQMGAARRMLERHMLRANATPTAFHYAILIDGFVRQREFDVANKVHGDMQRNKIAPDVSVRLAVQRLQVMSAMDKANIVHEQGQPQFEIPEELLEESFQPTPESMANKLPRLGEARFNVLQSQPGAFFDFLLSTYGKLKAFDFVKYLLDRYTKLAQSRDTPAWEHLPLRFIYHIMRYNYHQRDHDDVERYWNLAKSTATQNTSSSTTDGSTVVRPAPSRKALNRHLEVYMRSLAELKQLSRITETTADLYSNGFDLDNLNWNTYVQLSAGGDRWIDAFSIAETHLIPSFTGWQRKDYKAKRISALGLRSPGLEYQAPRGTYLKSTELRITFKTAIRLGAIVRKLREDAPFSWQAKESLEMVQKTAPKTYQAIMSMPQHALTHILGLPRPGDAAQPEQSTGRDMGRTIRL